ncbi:unannotated protein [freshwater metagenome]|uniref:Unannotated protein n=1 Tax=freshwater metagenome TaxID=449393 RepID=A0A6J7P510_9ZZZZ|nr:hypothetical protein [Actinomycetota bacterium]MSW10829.1 hypothetical protein [Actinomycetota bacterium]MSY17669.1 hypothetical protein [Actinomycetota bacterium]
MPSVEVSAPVSSVASDRMVLGVGWVRPGAGGIGGTLDPAGYCDVPSPACAIFCFEGHEE